MQCGDTVDVQCDLTLSRPIYTGIGPIAALSEAYTGCKHSRSAGQPSGSHRIRSLTNMAAADSTYSYVHACELLQKPSQSL